MRMERGGTGEPGWWVPDGCDPRLSPLKSYQIGQTLCLLGSGLCCVVLRCVVLLCCVVFFFEQQAKLIRLQDQKGRTIWKLSLQRGGIRK